LVGVVVDEAVGGSVEMVDEGFEILSEGGKVFGVAGEAVVGA